MGERCVPDVQDIFQIGIGIASENLYRFAQSIQLIHNLRWNR